MARTSSALHAGAAAADERLDLLERRHRRVAGRGHGQGAVRGAVLDRRREVAVLQQPVDQPGGEAVAAADPVEDLQARAGASPRRTGRRAQAIAPQSLTVALRTARSVVATTLKFGYSLATSSIIRRKFAASSSREVLVGVSARRSRGRR